MVRVQELQEAWTDQLHLSKQQWKDLSNIELTGGYFFPKEF